MEKLLAIKEISND